MKWIVEIDNHPKLRILVVFVPVDETLVFYGEQRSSKGTWVTFCMSSHPMDVQILNIEDILYDTYQVLKKRIKALDSANRILSLIPKIGITEEYSNAPETLIDKDEVYGEEILNTEEDIYGNKIIDDDINSTYPYPVGYVPKELND